MFIFERIFVETILPDCAGTKFRNGYESLYHENIPATMANIAVQPLFVLRRSYFFVVVIDVDIYLDEAASDSDFAQRQQGRNVK